MFGFRYFAPDLESGAEVARLSLVGVRPVRTEISDMVPGVSSLGRVL